MGKATILSGGTAGFYTVTYHYDTTKALARKAALEAEKAAINATEKSALEANITATNTAINNALAALNAVIPGYPTTVTENELLAYQDAVIVQRSIKNEYERQLNALKVRLTSIEAEISRLLNLVSTETRAAWCADYSESLTGVIGTIEVNGDTDNIILRPGYTSEAWSQLRDGMAQQAAASPSASQTFYNWAMRPGWQKWKPRHQIGTITVKTNTGGSTYVYNLTMDAATALDHPDGANLSTTQASTLSNVAATYSCGSAIYQVGDRVVVEFTGQDWNTPTIIGFESSPRSCYFRIRLYDYDGSTIIDPNTVLKITNDASTAQFIRFTLVDAVTLAKIGYDGATDLTSTYDYTNNHWLIPAPVSGNAQHIFVAATHRVFTQYPNKTNYDEMHPFASLSGYTAGEYDISLDRFAWSLTGETRGYFPGATPPFTDYYSNQKVFTNRATFGFETQLGEGCPYGGLSVTITASPGPGSRSFGTPISTPTTYSIATTGGSVSGVAFVFHASSNTSGGIGIEGVTVQGDVNYGSGSNLGNGRVLTVAPSRPDINKFSWSTFTRTGSNDC